MSHQWGQFAQTYLQPHYGNGVFSNIYLSMQRFVAAWGVFSGDFLSSIRFHLSWLDITVLDIMHWNIPPYQSALDFWNIKFEISILVHIKLEFYRLQQAKKSSSYWEKKSSSSNWICSNRIFQTRYFKLDLQKINCT